VGWISIQKSLSAVIKNRKTRMKMQKLQIAIIAGALSMAAQARAQLYDIGFTASDNSMLAEGTLYIPSVNVNGGGLATSGSINIAYSTTGVPTGTYSLVGTAAGTLQAGGFYDSPSLGGYVIQYDDQVLGLNAVPYLDQYGLLFANNLTVLQVNFYSNGNTGGNNIYDTVSIYTGGQEELVSGAMSISAVPEPSTMIAGAMVLLPFGASALRSLRKNRTV
jgi:hypothetical protein